MHQRPSRCCMWPIVSAATSDRRKAQPSSTAIMARSRSPLVVVISGALRSACACFSDSQLPARTPMDLLAPADRWSSGGPAEERQGIPLSQLLAMALEGRTSGGKGRGFHFRNSVPHQMEPCVT